MLAPRIEAFVVGAGLMGRWHAEAARRCGATVAGVVDRDVARAEALAARFPGARAVAGLGEAFGAPSGTPGGSPALAVAHVCTPLESHLPIALDAIARGCHVLIEKPMVADAEAADRLHAAAASRGVIVVPVHQFLFQRGAARALSLLPALGPLRLIEMEIASTGAEGSSGARDAVALEILPHGLAFAARILGTRIAECEWAALRASPGEVTAMGVVGETRVSLRVSLHGRPPMNRLRLVTDGGTVDLDLFTGFAVVDRSLASRAMKLARPLRSALAQGAAASRELLHRALAAETAYPGLRELVRRFYASVRGTAATPIPVAETRAVTAAWARLRSLVSVAGSTAATPADLSPSR